MYALGPEQPPSSHLLREERSICQHHQLSIIPLIGVDLEVGGSRSHAGSLTNPTFNVPYQPKLFSLHKAVRALHSLSLVEFSESRKGQLLSRIVLLDLAGGIWVEMQKQHF